MPKKERNHEKNHQNGHGCDGKIARESERIIEGVNKRQPKQICIYILFTHAYAHKQKCHKVVKPTFEHAACAAHSHSLARGRISSVDTFWFLFFTTTKWLHNASKCCCSVQKRRQHFRKNTTTKDFPLCVSRRSVHPVIAKSHNSPFDYKAGYALESMILKYSMRSTSNHFRFRFCVLPSEQILSVFFGSRWAEFIFRVDIASFFFPFNLWEKVSFLRV